MEQQPQIPASYEETEHACYEKHQVRPEERLFTPEAAKRMGIFGNINAEDWNPPSSSRELRHQSPDAGYNNYLTSSKLDPSLLSPKPWGRDRIISTTPLSSSPQIKRMSFKGLLNDFQRAWKSESPFRNFGGQHGSPPGWVNAVVWSSLSFPLRTSTSSFPWERGESHYYFLGAWS